MFRATRPSGTVPLPVGATGSGWWSARASCAPGHSLPPVSAAQGFWCTRAEGPEASGEMWGPRDRCVCVWGGCFQPAWASAASVSEEQS